MIKLDKSKYVAGDTIHGFAYLTVPARAPAAQLTHLRTVVVELEGNLLECINSWLSIPAVLASG